MPNITFKEKIKQTFNILYYGDEGFYNDIEALKKKYFVMDDEEYIPSARKSKKMAKAINLFLKKYRLSKIYYGLIFLFILRGELREDLLEDYSVEFIKGFPRGNDDKSFYLEVYPETTIKDIQAVWKKIKSDIQQDDYRKMTKQRKRDDKMSLMISLTKAERYLRLNNEIICDTAVLAYMRENNPDITENLMYYDIPKIRLLRKKMVSKLS